MPTDLPTPTELDDGIREVPDRLTPINQALCARLDEVETKCNRLEVEIFDLNTKLDYLERQQPC